MVRGLEAALADRKSPFASAVASHYFGTDFSRANSVTALSIFERYLFFIGCCAALFFSRGLPKRHFEAVQWVRVISLNELKMQRYVCFCADSYAGGAVKTRDGIILSLDRNWS